MQYDNDKSVNVAVRDGRANTDIGFLGLFYILVLAVPWFAPAIGLGAYVGFILEWHSLAVTLVTILALMLNYAFLLMFIKKLPNLFTLLGAAEFAVWAFWILETEFSFDIYWQIFLSTVAALMGWKLFAVLVMKVKSHER